MADFPPGSLVLKEDSKYRSQKMKDPALRHEMDGGYVASRPRYTRPPRRTFITGFTNITEGEKALLEAFYELKRGGSDSFTWLDRVSGVTYVVRFVGEPDYQYAGIGTTFRWNVTGISLEQV